MNYVVSIANHTHWTRKYIEEEMSYADGLKVMHCIYAHHGIPCYLTNKNQNSLLTKTLSRINGRP